MRLPLLTDFGLRFVLPALLATRGGRGLGSLPAPGSSTKAAFRATWDAIAA